MDLLYCNHKGHSVNDRAKDADGTEDSWDSRFQAGVKRIKTHWPRLQPQTKKLLMQDGFDERGSHKTSLESWDDSSNLAYSLGLFEEAVKASIPMEQGDRIPSCYTSDEVLHQSANLVLNRQYCDPEFTGLALHACIKHQAANAVSSFYYNGGKRSEGKAVLGKTIAGIALSIALAASIGNGLVLALEHDATSASVLAFIAMFSYGTFKNLDKPAVETKWEVAYSNWLALILRDFHVGTAHGVEQQLQQFVRQGTHVPSVLFDLCAALQQGTDMSRRVHITTTREST
jgi:hypothetical protein